MRTGVALLVALFVAGAAHAAGFAGYLAAVDADGVALGGLDPVALAGGAAASPAPKAVRSAYEGAIYLFETAENKAAFDKEPAKYAPQFGGFCVASVAEGKLVPGDPRHVLADPRTGKRYALSQGRSIGENLPAVVAQAETNWPGLVRDHATAVGDAQLTAGRELTLDAARQVADAAAAFARRAGAPGASIAIVDSGGHLLFMERLDGTYPASAGLAADKARTAALFRRPSRALEDATDAGRASLVTMGYVLVRGAVPITWKGAVVGAIGVSGAAGAWQDEEIALAGLRATFGGK